MKTIQAVIIGTYTEEVAPGAANKVVGNLGDYLKSLNYVCIPDVPFFLVYMHMNIFTHLISLIPGFVQ